MLAALLLAAALVDGAGEPAFMADAFCPELKAFTAAAADRPEPFASLVDRQNDRFGPDNATRAMPGFGPCTRYRFQEGLTITCHGLPGGPLSEAQPKLAAQVADCLQLPPVAMPSGGFDLPVTEFRSATFTVVVDTKSCDRCRGMPQVELKIVAPRRR